MTELAMAWTASIARLEKLFVPCPDWHLVEEAEAAGRPIIFVTPHLGCYDIAGRYVASRVSITALYRPPKLRWLEPIMEAGRARGGATTAPADASGVRALLKALKQGKHIMILPDQVPAAEKGGEGVWAPFLGEPAYTMTLLPRLAETSNAVVLFFFAERLQSGRGYLVHIRALPHAYAPDKTEAAAQTNAMVESLIDMAPAQYLWGYNRFKQPAGAPPPPNHLHT
jgi:Kdo2-lipid IVA lauroyltransferase/acyltransferase